jgi:hypothetical protein
MLPQLYKLTVHLRETEQYEALQKPSKESKLSGTALRKSSCVRGIEVRGLEIVV